MIGAPLMALCAALAAGTLVDSLEVGHLRHEKSHLIRLDKDNYAIVEPLRLNPWFDWRAVRVSGGAVTVWSPFHGRMEPVQLDLLGQGERLLLADVVAFVEDTRGANCSSMRLALDQDSHQVDSCTLASPMRQLSVLGHSTLVHDMHDWVTFGAGPLHDLHPAAHLIGRLFYLSNTLVYVLKSGALELVPKDELRPEVRQRLVSFNLELRRLALGRTLAAVHEGVAAELDRQRAAWPEEVAELEAQMGAATGKISAEVEGMFAKLDL